MGKCSECGKKILYNQFKRYRGKILCYTCYDTRLERKKAKKEAAEQKVKEDAKKVLEKSLKEAKENNGNYNPYEENQKDDEPDPDTGDNMPVKVDEEEDK